MLLKRRQLFGLAGVTIAAGTSFGAWLFYSGGHNYGRSNFNFKPYPFDPVSTENFQQKLFIPVASGPFGVLDVVGPLKIRATAATFAILPNRVSPFLLYQTEYETKAFQNPIFRIESGGRFSSSLDNQLGEPTIIHWHGLHTPSAMDGHPSSTIGSGKSFTYDFTVRNRGGTYWYHTHAHKLTAKQAYNGLASFFLVEDDDQRRLGKSLDLKLGETDLPIVIQDKQFNPDGTLRYQPNAHESMMGWLGDVILTNLTPNATLVVAPRIYRFRLLNGSNARSYRLAFVRSNGNQKLAYWLIGTDGGLLDTSLALTRLMLSPGERAEILINFSGMLSQTISLQK